MLTPDLLAAANLLVADTVLLAEKLCSCHYISSLISLATSPSTWKTSTKQYRLTRDDKALICALWVEKGAHEARRKNLINTVKMWYFEWRNQTISYASSCWMSFTAQRLYLTDICSCCSDSRLRSSARGNFVLRRTRTRFADSSVAVAGPVASKSLPVYIRNIGSHSAFCRQLKTYCFTVADRITLLMLIITADFSYFYVFYVFF